MARFRINTLVRKSLLGDGVRVMGEGEGLTSEAVATIISAQINAVSPRNTASIYVEHTNNPRSGLSYSELEEDISTRILRDLTRKRQGLLPYNPY